MNLDPDVKQAIQRYRGRALLARRAMLAVLSLMIALIMVLVIVPYAAGNTTFSPLVRGTGGRTAILIAALVVLVLFLVGMVTIYVPSIIRDGAAFGALTAGGGGFDIAKLGRFLNTLDQVSKEAGVHAPRVKVIRGDRPNALAFEADGGPEIGVTVGALEADLTYSEVGAIMAQELAGILAGDYLARPGPITPDALITGLFGLYTALALFAVPMAASGGRSLVAVAVGFILWMALLLMVFFNRKRRNARGHDDILADSIAVRLTGEPAPLLEAVKKLDSLVNNAKDSALPVNDMGLDYMFMPPYRWSETPQEFLRRQRDELGLKWSDASVESRAARMTTNLEELSAWGKGLVAERITNLEAIQEGRWMAFESRA
ncbi:MAG: M56 family metallopeptidase [Actinomycetota bacterium]